MNKKTKELVKKLPPEALNYAIWEKSCEKFIEEAIHIEDRDTEGLAIPFELWPKQKEALQRFVEERLVIVMKARQLGLTWLALSYALWRMIFQPGYSVIGLSQRESDAKELIRRMKFILRYLPDWLVVEGRKNAGKIKNSTHKYYEDTVMSITINHPEGEPSTFQVMSSSPDSGRSFTANAVILDEWAYQQWAKEVFDSAYPTINRPTGGQVLGLSTNERGTLFEEQFQKAIRGEGVFTPVFLPWYSDPRRTEEWYEETKKALPHSIMQQYPSTPEEAMSAGEMTALPEFTRDIHVCEPFPIPDHWFKFMGHDPGYNHPFAWVWFAVSPDGIVYLYREYTRRMDDGNKIFYSDQAAEAAKMSLHVDEQTGETYYEDVAYIVSGLDAFNKSTETGKTYVDYDHDGGLPKRWGFIPCSTDRRLRLATWHEYLKPFPHPEKEGVQMSRLQIFSNCTMTIETLPQLVLDDKDLEKVADMPKLDNCYDAGGYALIEWHVFRSESPSSKMRSETESPVSQHIRKMDKRKKKKKKRHQV